MRELTELLEFLESELDSEHIDGVIKNTMSALERRASAHTPIIKENIEVGFRPFSIDEIHAEMWKMMYNELIACAVTARNRDDSIPMIRANYGVGSLPTLFGIESYIVNGNMPWVKHLDDTDAIRRLVARGIPDINAGYGEKIIETYAFYNEALAKYPNCRHCIHLYHPDFQGPFDVAHLLWGADIYYAFYDEPELLHELLELVTQTYIKAMSNIKRCIDDEIDDYNFHWQTLYGGKVTLRNDSAVNLSKEMYLEFVRPYDEKILEHFGSGSMHFCGRADQIVFDMMETQNLRSMNFGHMSNVQFGEPYLEFIYDGLIQNNLSVAGYKIPREEFEALNKDKFSKGISYRF